MTLLGPSGFTVDLRSSCPHIVACPYARVILQSSLNHIMWEADCRPGWLGLAVNRVAGNRENDALYNRLITVSKLVCVCVLINGI